MVAGCSAADLDAPGDSSDDAVEGAQLGASSARKFHPGHYVLFRSSDKASTTADDLSVVGPKIIADTTPDGTDGLDDNGVRGFVKRYRWRDLDKGGGAYDLSAISADLDTAASWGKRLIVMIEDRTYTTTNPMPDYLTPDSIPGGKRTDDCCVAKSNGGYTGVRWHPTYVSRMKALIRAIGARFDSPTNPSARRWNFEGVSVQETAHGFSGTTMDALGYTPDKYQAAYEGIVSDALTGSGALPAALFSGRFFWHMNFFVGAQARINTIARNMSSPVLGADNGFTMGGPDLLRNRDSLNRLVYPFYNDNVVLNGTSLPQTNDRIPQFIDVQGDSYDESGTMEDLFVWGRQQLEVDYLFWTYYPWDDRLHAWCTNAAGKSACDDDSAATAITNRQGFNRRTWEKAKID
jgi:hypothetical protein